LIPFEDKLRGGDDDEEEEEDDDDDDDDDDDNNVCECECECGATSGLDGQCLRGRPMGRFTLFDDKIMENHRIGERIMEHHIDKRRCIEISGRNYKEI
jgi:hypothetical protein